MSVERTQRTYIRLVFGGFVGLVLFILLCGGGYHFYAAMQSRHLARRAAAYLSGGDLRQAMLSAQSALQLNAKNVNAVRILAQISEASNNRIALDWRRKATEVAPNSVEDLLALATCALQFADVTVAEKALQRVDENGRQRPDFHVATARLAEVKRQPTEAEKEWKKAVELAPGNKSYQLQFALALLRINNLTKRETALSILQQLRGDDKQRVLATRALILDGTGHRGDPERVKAWARDLQSYPGATFQDRILYLEILRQLQDPGFAGYLTNVEKDAVSKPTDLAALLSWMTANGMSLLAINFAHTLPNEEVGKWSVPLVMAEAYAKLTDWAGLEALVKNGSWGPFDFLRRAYFSLALRKQDKPATAGREWASAQKEASSQGQYLAMLARATSDWGWQKETLELLWLLTKDPERQLEAFQELYQRYADESDTPGMYRVLVRLGELEPDNPRIQNDLAQISLLLNADVERAQKLAANLYRKEESNPAFASTYAFALYTKGDANGALKVMNRLSDSQLRGDPSLAAYYGVILARVGDKAKAQEYLKLSEPAKLLPEERELVAKAEATLK